MCPELSTTPPADPNSELATSKAAMQATGWVFDWDDATVFHPTAMDVCAKHPDAYCGWKTSGDGSIRIKLSGSGMATVSFGNPFWNLGATMLYLDTAAIASANQGTERQVATFAFTAGQILTLRDENSIIVLHSVSFVCNTIAPTHPDPTACGFTDVILGLDASKAVGQEGWDKQVAFAQKLIPDLIERGHRVGIYFVNAIYASPLRYKTGGDHLVGNGCNQVGGSLCGTLSRYTEVLLHGLKSTSTAYNQISHGNGPPNWLRGFDMAARWFESGFADPSSHDHDLNGGEGSQRVHISMTDGTITSYDWDTNVDPYWNGANPPVASYVAQIGTNYDGYRDTISELHSMPTCQPTVAPTPGPTSHPCDDGTSMCDTDHGSCIKEDNGEYSCNCDEGYTCQDACVTPWVSHHTSVVPNVGNVNYRKQHTCSLPSGATCWMPVSGSRP